MEPLAKLRATPFLSEREKFHFLLRTEQYPFNLPSTMGYCKFCMLLTLKKCLRASVCFSCLIKLISLRFSFSKASSFLSVSICARWWSGAARKL